MSDSQEYWFAARTRKGQELVIRNSLEKKQIEHFIPTEIVTRQLKYRRVRVEVPIIRNLIFVHTTKERACSLANEDQIPIYYIKDFSTRAMLVIPEKQMQDFMLVLEVAPRSVTLGDALLPVGTKVRVIEGDFCGVEGELDALPTRTYVIIRLNGLLTARVKVPKNYLEVITEYC